MKDETIEQAKKRYGNYKKIPNNLIELEIGGIYGSELLIEQNELIQLYNIYENGADFHVDTEQDYTPSSTKSKKSKHLIDKEARFMFSQPLDINIRPQGKTLKDIENDDEIKNLSIIQTLVKNVLKANDFNNNILKAAKDCFIAKRIAIIANFNNEGIKINFCPSLEFVYDVDINDPTKLIKLVCFYNINDSADKTEQRIYKKKYWLENDKCHINETIYDGLGVIVDEVIANLETKFNYIPGVVIINDGLTGDLKGQSDIGEIYEDESDYSRLSNADKDAKRIGMNQIKYVQDMSSKSTENLKIAPGALWDLTSDVANEMQGKVGTLENDMSYNEGLVTTLKRIETDMYERLDIPNTNIENIKGLITSGKGLKSLYWPLIVRCDEKMLVWIEKIETLINCIIEGAYLYPNSAKKYIYDKLPKIDYEIEIVNNYALPEDEIEEKTMDIQEVNSQAMSRKAYMKKWRKLTEEESEKELKQIALERQMLEDSWFSDDNESNKTKINQQANSLTNDGNGITAGINKLKDNI